MGKRKKEGQRPDWDSAKVRALRRYMGLSQDEMAGELGTRQQTISEWETGQYRPRGASARLLSIVAESAGFAYEAKSAEMESRQEESGG